MMKFAATTALLLFAAGASAQLRGGGVSIGRDPQLNVTVKGPEAVGGLGGHVDNRPCELISAIAIDPCSESGAMCGNSSVVIGIPRYPGRPGAGLVVSPIRDGLSVRAHPPVCTAVTSSPR